MSDKVILAYKEVHLQVNNDLQGYYFYAVIFKDGVRAKELPVHTSSGTSNPLDFEFHKQEAEKVYNQIILYIQARMQAQANNRQAAVNKQRLNI